MSPIAHSDGHDPPGLIDEFVPRVAAVIDDVVVGFEHPVGEPVDGVDGAPTASKVPEWLSSPTNLREAVHGQV